MLVYDENGNLIDTLEERNKDIMEKLAPVLETFLAEKKALMAMKRPERLGYRFSKQLYRVLASYGIMSATDFASIDYDILNDYWNKYLDLTAYYNTYFEIVDNKQLFMAFMGISSRQYRELEHHSDGDIVDLMNTINTAFIGLSFMAAESGNASDRAIKTRLEAKDHGHDMISATEEMAVKALAGERPMAEILGEAKTLGLNLPGLEEKK